MPEKGVVDRIDLTERLASAFRHVDEGQELIGRQRDRIYALGRAGVDVALARLVLARLEAWQTMRVADRQRLEDMLAALG